MRKMVFLLALAAMGVGAYRLISDHAPELLEKPREFLSKGLGRTGSGSASSDRISYISRGKAVDVKRFTEPKGLTIIDFTARW